MAHANDHYLDRPTAGHEPDTVAFDQKSSEGERCALAAIPVSPCHRQHALLVPRRRRKKPCLQHRASEARELTACD